MNSDRGCYGSKKLLTHLDDWVFYTWCAQVSLKFSQKIVLAPWMRCCQRGSENLSFGWTFTLLADVWRQSTFDRTNGPRLFRDACCRCLMLTASDAYARSPLLGPDEQHHDQHLSSIFQIENGLSRKPLLYSPWRTQYQVRTETHPLWFKTLNSRSGVTRRTAYDVGVQWRSILYSYE